MALHLAEIKCEIREIRLSNKPEQMLEVSPKGTVPILILEDKVIDESYDIVYWVIEQSNIFNSAYLFKRIKPFRICDSELTNER